MFSLFGFADNKNYTIHSARSQGFSAPKRCSRLESAFGWRGEKELRSCTSLDKEKEPFGSQSSTLRSGLADSRRTTRLYQVFRRESIGQGGIRYPQTSKLQASADFSFLPRDTITQDVLFVKGASELHYPEQRKGAERLLVFYTQRFLIASQSWAQSLHSHMLPANFLMFLLLQPGQVVVPVFGSITPHTPR